MIGDRLSRVGAFLQRYGLVLILAWFGAFKFTEAEALAIEPLLRHSPFMSWLYLVVDVRNASRLIGPIELATAALLLVRNRPAISSAGAMLAAGIFAGTLSFLFTTPGMWAWVDGVLVPAGAGGFIVKDVFLLGAALAVAGEGLRA